MNCSDAEAYENEDEALRLAYSLADTPFRTRMLTLIADRMTEERG